MELLKKAFVFLVFYPKNLSNVGITAFVFEEWKMGTLNSGDRNPFPKSFSMILKFSSLKCKYFG